MSICLYLLTVGRCLNDFVRQSLHRGLEMAWIWGRIHTFVGRVRGFLSPPFLISTPGMSATDTSLLHVRLAGIQKFELLNYARSADRSVHRLDHSQSQHHLIDSNVLDTVLLLYEKHFF